MIFKRLRRVLVLNLSLIGKRMLSTRIIILKQYISPKINALRYECKKQLYIKPKLI
jgi:hypothetical protein